MSRCRPPSAATPLRHLPRARCRPRGLHAAPEATPPPGDTTRHQEECAPPPVEIRRSAKGRTAASRIIPRGRSGAGLAPTWFKKDATSCIVGLMPGLGLTHWQAASSTSSICSLYPVPRSVGSRTSICFPLDLISCTHWTSSFDLG